MVTFRAKYFSETIKVGMLIKKLHIRPVTKLKFSFDPFTENVESIRRVMSAVHAKRVLQTAAVQMKIDVMSDRSKPQIDVDFADGHKLVFKTEHLKASEILERLLFYCNQKDTAQPEADLALTKMSGKPKAKRKK